MNAVLSGAATELPEAAEFTAGGHTLMTALCAQS